MCQVRGSRAGDPVRSVSSTTTAERCSSITTASPFHIAHPLRPSLHTQHPPLRPIPHLDHARPLVLGHAAPRATQPDFRPPARSREQGEASDRSHISIPRAYIPHSAGHKRPQTSMRGQPTHGWPACACPPERVSRPQRWGRGRPCAPDRSQPLTTMRCDETRRGARRRWGRDRRPGAENNSVWVGLCASRPRPKLGSWRS
jgi:hypothetical protein